jgi:release factor glutamine methyltransferase
MQKEITWLLREKYHGEKTDGFFADCARLEAGEPLAYIIGSIPFLGCDITLDTHPLIPRPETEFWVEKAIAEITRTIKDNTSVLDLCAGSGAIGVAVAKAIPSAQVTLAEIDPTHLVTIEKNLKANISEYSNRLGYYRHIQSDLFEQITGSFEFILTNPPYIDEAAHTVAASVVAHEPHLALFGGLNGMDIITKIIAKAASYLAPSGQLWIEHEPFQSAAVSRLATSHGFSCQTMPDQYDTERYSVLTRAVAK